MTHILHTCLQKIKRIGESVFLALQNYSRVRAEVMVAHQIAAMKSGESYDYILHKIRKGEGNELFD